MTSQPPPQKRRKVEANGVICKNSGKKEIDGYESEDPVSPHEFANSQPTPRSAKPKNKSKKGFNSPRMNMVTYRNSKNDKIKSGEINDELELAKTANSRPQQMSKPISKENSKKKRKFKPPSGKNKEKSKEKDSNVELSQQSDESDLSVILRELNDHLHIADEVITKQDESKEYLEYLFQLRNGLNEAIEDACFKIKEKVEKDHELVEYCLSISDCKDGISIGSLKPQGGTGSPKEKNAKYIPQQHIMLVCNCRIKKMKQCNKNGENEFNYRNICLSKKDRILGRVVAQDEQGTILVKLPYIDNMSHEYYCKEKNRRYKIFKQPGLFLLELEYQACRTFGLETVVELGIIPQIIKNGTMPEKNINCNSSSNSNSNSNSGDNGNDFCINVIDLQNKVQIIENAIEDEKGKIKMSI